MNHRIFKITLSFNEKCRNLFQTKLIVLLQLNYDSSTHYNYIDAKAKIIIYKQRERYYSEIEAGLELQYTLVHRL